MMPDCRIARSCVPYRMGTVLVQAGKKKKVVPVLPATSDGYLFPTSAAIVASTTYCIAPTFLRYLPTPVLRPQLPPPALHPFSTLPRPALTLSIQPLSRDSLNRPPPVSPYQSPSLQPQVETRLAPTTVFVQGIFFFSSASLLFWNRGITFCPEL